MVLPTHPLATGLAPVSDSASKVWRKAEHSKPRLTPHLLSKQRPRLAVLPSIGGERRNRTAALGAPPVFKAGCPPLDGAHHWRRAEHRSPCTLTRAPCRFQRPPGTRPDHSPALGLRAELAEFRPKSCPRESNPQIPRFELVVFAVSPGQDGAATRTRTETPRRARALNALCMPIPA